MIASRFQNLETIETITGFHMIIAATAFDYRSFGKFVMLAAGFFCEGKASSLIALPEFRDKNRLPAVCNFVSSLKWMEKHAEYGVKHIFRPGSMCKIYLLFTFK